MFLFDILEYLLILRRIFLLNCVNLLQNFECYSLMEKMKPKTDNSFSFPCAVCHLLFAVCYLLFAISYLLFAILMFIILLQTFGSSRFNVFLDIWVSTIFYILLEISLLVVYGADVSNPAWLIYLVSIE